MGVPGDNAFLPPAENQPELGLSPIQGDAFERLEQAGEFTGQRLKQFRPDTYQAVQVLLAQGVGVIRIGQLLKVSPNTVMAVRDAEYPRIDEIKLSLASIAHQAATIASEGIRDQLAKLMDAASKSTYATMEVKDLRDLAVIYGLMVTNGQLLAGEATARTEAKAVTRPEHDDFNRYISGLKAAGTSLVVEIPGTKEGGPAVPGGPGSGPDGAGTDSQSDGKAT